ncbi:MAG: T9SS type A sorting domain-containing protein [Bacteroidetes bacterium]|nr:T9SS type A sorting domain-containing protein [Bacteroidota bacterium]
MPNNGGGFTIPFDSLFFPNGHDKSIHRVAINGEFRVINQYGCYSDVAFYQIWVYPLVIDLQASRRRIAPGQSTTLSASTIWNTQNSKTKWFKNNQLIASGVDSVTVSDTGIYKVQMRATLAAGNCVNSKQIKITPKPVVSARMGAENELIEGKESLLDLQIGPNPASDQIQISGYDERVEILDVNGKIVDQFNFNTFEGTSPQHVDISELQNGIYLIRSGDQTVKLIVQH